MGDWHHLVFNRETDFTTEMWIDGILMSTGSSNRDLSAIDADILLGSNHNNGTPTFLLTGGIDEFAIYDYALAPEQVADHFAARNSPEPTTLTLLGFGLAAFARRRRRRA